jgi:hypothetical protein
MWSFLINLFAGGLFWHFIKVDGLFAKNSAEENVSSVRFLQGYEDLIYFSR